MFQISANRALYIKLGEGGKWEKESIENGELRFGYQDIPHELCINNDWIGVSKALQIYSSTQAAITNHRNQIQEFYTADTAVIWITFYGGRLWWCFASQEIVINDRNEKVRKTIGKWQDTSINKNTLLYSRISGKLLSTGKFRGTICNVSEFQYLLHKINDTIEPHVGAALVAFKKMQQSLIPIIRNLHELDFEIFVDLIFRQSGWQRVGVTGGNEKDIDLDLISLATNERIAVQIKSKADATIWMDYKSRYAKLKDYGRFYFVTHTPSNSLTEKSKTNDDKSYILWDADELAAQAIRGGLTGWLIDKAS